MAERKDILLAGVGGQGVLLASKLLGEAALASGHNVMMGEVHGMAQRGGSVQCTVRIGDVHGPLIHKADVLVGFEPVEAIRAAGYVRADTCVVLNVTPIIPFTVSLGAEEYPSVDRIVAALSKISDMVLPVEATKIAENQGGAIAANMVMLGTVIGTGVLPISRETARATLKRGVSQLYLELDLGAFDAGWSVGSTWRLGKPTLPPTH